MADTIRELLIQAVVTQAATIQKPTYNTNIGDNVFRARRTFDPSEYPVTNIIPGIEEVEKDYQRNKCRMQIRIEGIGLYMNINPSVFAESMLGDLIKCFTNSDNKNTAHGGYASKFQYIQGSTDEYPEEGHKTIGAYIILEVEYYTVLGDPYAQS